MDIRPPRAGAAWGRLEPFPESPLILTVLQALPERERFELILQKLTELGVNRIVPVESSRSTTLAERDRQQTKSHRWPAVILRAAKQCRRADLPQLDPVRTWSEALAGCDGELRLLLWEKGGETTPLAQAVTSSGLRQVTLAVGPEGGWSEAEVAEARANGFVPVTLGSRILRTETAAIVGAALLQHLLGDLGRECRE